MINNIIAITIVEASQGVNIKPTMKPHGDQMKGIGEEKGTK